MRGGEVSSGKFLSLVERARTAFWANEFYLDEGKRDDLDAYIAAFNVVAEIKRAEELVDVLKGAVLENAPVVDTWSHPDGDNWREYLGHVVVMAVAATLQQDPKIVAEEKRRKRLYSA